MRQLLILATGNAHKAREFAEMLGSWEVLTLKNIGFQGDILENGRTFEENAQIKAASVMDFLKQNPVCGGGVSVVCADDSGLEVDHLGGAPGVLSARFAGIPSNDAANTSKLLEALAGVAGVNRTARFRCVIAAATLGMNAPEKIFSGSCEGKIGFQPKGTHGFGYDPVFFPEGFCHTFAEIQSDEKNRISHRSKAVAAFKKWLQTL